MKVGLLGPPGRDEIRRLAIRLEERGVETVALDPRPDPRFRVEGTVVEALGVDLSGLAGLYVADLGIRSPWRRTAAGTADLPASREALAASRRHLAAWNTVLQVLDDRGLRVVNPPAAHDLHALKPWEVHVYARRGIPHPETLATSDPDVPAALPGDVPRVTKGMVGGHGFTEAYVPGSGAPPLPLLVQERVGQVDVRAFVLAGKVIAAAEIRSTDPVDSRRGATRVRPLDPPRQVVEAALAAATCWRMPFCAVDLRRDRSGEIAVLECNSAPFFAAFERRTGLDVAGPLADFLCGRGRLREEASA